MPAVTRAFGHVFHRRSAEPEIEDAEQTGDGQAQRPQAKVLGANPLEYEGRQTKYGYHADEKPGITADYIDRECASISVRAERVEARPGFDDPAALYCLI